MRVESVVLGEREYKLTELPLRRAKAFRETLKSHFGGLIDLFERAPSTDITNTTQVAGLMRMLSSTLLESIDLAAELLCEYSDTINKDKEYILDNAVGSQIVDAFLAAIGLTFPFLGSSRASALMRTVQNLGSKNEATPTNSPSMNGESGQTSLTASR